MATTTNFGWETPDDTDLVKDGAAAIRTALGGVDTSFVDLKGGTSGQILSKASNTDLDFAWVADAGSPTSYGFAAGKNKIINGDFSIWQRGTSSTTGSTFLADRWLNVAGAGGTFTASQQAFTPGAAPVAGYESQYFFRYASVNVGDARILQTIEDVRTFAGQTVTVSFWAKSATSDALANIQLSQRFGSGGSAQVDTTSSAFTLTSSWARYSATLTLPSISGKTIGANNALRLQFTLKTSATFEFDVWGVQVEAGSTATTFQTATGNPASELQACQRYYQRFGGYTAFENMGQGSASSATRGQIKVCLPVTMRTSATSVDYSTLNLSDGVSGFTVTAVTIDQAGKNMIAIFADVASGLTQYRNYFIYANNSTSAYLGFSAEL